MPYHCCVLEADRVQRPITVLDLFAGCGGLTEGFHQFSAGRSGPAVFQSVGAVEWDSAAAASYAMNFGDVSAPGIPGPGPIMVCRDIVGWDPPWVEGDIDVVVGGPPCQGFSGLNRNKVKAERNSLWTEFLRVVHTLQPKVFVIENVDRFLRSVEFADLEAHLGTDMQNYELVEPDDDMIMSQDRRNSPMRFLLNAADYGALQARRRAIVIGVRNDLGGLDARRMKYPRPTRTRRLEDARAAGSVVGLGPWEPADEVFRKSMDLPTSGTDLPTDRRPVRVSGVPRQFPGVYSTTDLHITRNPEAVSRARYCAIPAGGNRKDLRGRYAYSYEGGEPTIVEKVGSFRSEKGELEPVGIYVIVEDGRATEDAFVVRSSEPVTPGESARRKAEVFEVEVEVDGRLEKGRMEYLSTLSWDSHVAGSGDVMGRVRLGAPSVTIRTEFFKPEKGRYLHPTENRPLTHYEAALLQGFPPDFKWCGTKTEIARQIGNAVPIPLGERIASSIYEFLR